MFPITDSAFYFLVFQLGLDAVLLRLLLLAVLLPRNRWSEDNVLAYGRGILLKRLVHLIFQMSL